MMGFPLRSSVLIALVGGVMGVACGGGGHSRYYFVDFRSSQPSALISTDGTVAGTREIGNQPEGVRLPSGMSSGAVSVDGPWFTFATTTGRPLERRLLYTDGFAPFKEIATIRWEEPGCPRQSATATCGVYAPTVLGTEGSDASPNIFAKRAFFTRFDIDFGFELWTSDGTSQGTKRAWHEYFHSLGTLRPVIRKGILYFSLFTAPSFTGDDHYLVRSDGTDAGTRIVTRLGGGSHEIAGFMGDDDPVILSGRAREYRVWRVSDRREYVTASMRLEAIVVGGSVYVEERTPPDGPTTIRRFDDAGAHEIFSLPALHTLTFMRGTGNLFFAEVSGVRERYVLASDGTTGGTIVVHRAPSLNFAWRLPGDQIGLQHFDVNGDFWRTDGTIDGTFVIGKGEASRLGGLGDRVVWMEFASGGDHVWSSDGTRNPPVLLYTMH